MHHFLYPIQDAYVSNNQSDRDLNFGIDELLIIGVGESYVKVLNSTKEYTYNNNFIVSNTFQNYTGNVTGSITVCNSIINAVALGNNVSLTSSFFSGSVANATLNGSETGSLISISGFTGNLYEYSGSIMSNTLTGFLSSSIYNSTPINITGSLINFVGVITGYLTGTEIKNQTNNTTVNSKYINRSLLKFDLNFISQSISSGDIENPNFYIKLKSVQVSDLPVSYKIYAFPISQSWVQGDGYYSDGGSSEGVSWHWKDRYNGSLWSDSYTTDPITASVDYLNDYNLVSESFKRGGGTWYNIPCTQSFSYQVSDINLNITPIANAWLSNQIPNEGIILMISEETNPSSSNANIMFFSNQTNTIYSPKLDVCWDDVSWITGSNFTSSVNISTYNIGINGTISGGSTITNSNVFGNVNGNGYLIINGNYEIDSGSLVSLTGLSGSVDKLNIFGNVSGTSSVDANNNYYITCSLLNGNLSGSTIYAQYSSSILFGTIVGEFNGDSLVNSKISGSLTTPTLYSFVSGNLLGSVLNGTDNGGTFNGIVLNGPLQGAYVSIPFTGSYSYITSNCSITSSVNISSSILQPLDTTKPYSIVIQNLKKEYSSQDFAKIKVFSREKYPFKTFEKAPQQVGYITPKALPTSSYYAIKDNQTEEIIIDFDNYTKLSCDELGNYFYLDTTGLAQERYYRVLVKVIDQNSKVYTFDMSDVFKIRR